MKIPESFCTCVWVQVDKLMILILKDYECPHPVHRAPDQASLPVPVYMFRPNG